MYEFHGWATIRETYENIDNDQTNEVVILVKKYINALEMFNWIFDIKAFNGNYHLIVSGFTNHALPASDQLFGLYNYVAQVAPGSYGILYIRNDEDEKETNNSFRVHVLSKGIFVEKADTFLSPFIPIVEDD